MEKIRLGKTNILVSRLGFGGIPIQRLSEDDAVAVVKKCLDLGITFLDTAGNWSGWAQVPGGGTTDVALAATVFNSKLYLFGKGINDKREYVNTLDTAGNWSGWAQVPGGGTTDVALCATVFNGKIYLFGKGIDDKREYVNTFGPAGN